ncbi:chondroitin sulfate proteoglycan 5 isoform X3 [Ascaphus truei]|uniref:chondroitin sulfate proteoglycan 5 isoform X3 n=1 Tax=Ascaphus truei TaxID=8439 RepID=UPI003F5A9176
MDSCLKCWGLAALFCTLICYCIDGTAGEPKNGTSALGSGPEGVPPYHKPDTEVHPSLLERETLDAERNPARKTKSTAEDSFLDNKTWRATGTKRSQKKPPVEYMVPSGSTTASSIVAVEANDFLDSESTLKYHPSGITMENNGSSICVGCSGEAHIDGMPPARSLLAEPNDGGGEAVTSLVWPVDVELRTKLAKAGVVPVTESQEDSGSGDPHVRSPASQATHASVLGREWDLGSFMEGATASPSQSAIIGGKELLSPYTDKVISLDSVETDHLLQVSRETVLQSPSPSGTEPHDQSPQKSARTEVSFEAEKSQGRFKMLEGASSQHTAQGAQGSTDITVVTDKMHHGSPSPSLPPISPLKTSEPPSDHSVTDIIDIDYYDLFDVDGHGVPASFPGSSMTGGDSTKKAHEKKTHWAMPELYDDFTPFDESDFYPTTSFYADGDDEGGIEDDDDDDIEEADDVEDEDAAARELEDVNNPREATLTPKIQTIMQDEKPTSRQHVPHQTFILYGGELNPKFHPEINKDLTQTMSGSSDNSTECKTGHVKRNNSCKSVCEIYPTYCYNGGQCYIVENTGAFCRCNTQDYIWHKGMRCESIITDFQVMCVAVGTAALVVLLLFMMTVFFAKKLYLLKTENYKLRKRNRYRTPSELHNDNFSLSTIAEGSHPNEDPNAPQKVQDLPKACLKDEEPFNIQNSLSPKHESGKGDPDSADLNCVLNNLT